MVPTTKPATAGTCGLVSCGHAADLETTTRTGPDTWTVRKSCFNHCTDAEMVALIEATTGDEFDAILAGSEAD